MPRLFVESGKKIGADFPVKDGMVLGRMEECDVLIDDPKSSRRHARIMKQGAQYFIVDLNSSNGTYLNDVLVKKSPLVFGDRIRIGDTVLVFTEEPEEDLVGSRLGGFEIMERLGARETGVIYKARQVALDRIVALKILDRGLSEDAAFVKRFKERAQAAATLRHPNIVQIFDVGEVEGRHFVAMEYVQGKSLRDILKEGEQILLTMEDKLNIAKQMAEALVYTHRQGILHGNLTPINILLTEKKEVKLSDFGGVRRDLPLAARDVTSLYYISPEEALGRKPDKQSEIYTLGIVLFQMVTGELPFKATGALELIREHTERDIPPPDIINSNVPASFADVIYKMCAREPERRFASIVEVREALSHVSLKGGSRREKREAAAGAVAYAPAGERGREPPAVERSPKPKESSSQQRRYEVAPRQVIVPVRKKGGALSFLIFLGILVVAFFAARFGVEFICSNLLKK
ncbi:MAG: serine/threonine-protein kinase [Planctomycetota bacterium]|nr:serine/threonine-protein kinase [Planctomycetota bacterium]